MTFEYLNCCVVCCVLFIGLFVYVYIWQMNQPVRTINITKKNQSNTVHYNPCWPESIIFHHFFLIIHNIRLWMNMIKKRFALLQILVVAVVFEHLNNIVVVYNFSGFKHTKKHSVMWMTEWRSYSYTIQFLFVMLSLLKYLHLIQTIHRYHILVVLVICQLSMLIQFDNDDEDNEKFE